MSKRIITEKICLYCQKKFIVPYSGQERRRTMKFCSNKCARAIPWNKNKKLHYPTWNKGKTGLQIAWNKGLKWGKWMSEEGRKKALKNLKMKGGREHWNWRGGITEQNRLIRNSKEYKNWRKKVFERDRFRCVLCGYRSKKRKDIRADHIKPFNLYPELRFDVNNGRILCLPCDLKYGWQNFRENNPRVKK